MQVYIGTANNPQTGQDVPSVKLKAVGGENPADIEEFVNR